MKTRIELTEEFLKEQFEICEYYKQHQDEKNYRLEHTYRVANIGKKVAEQEGFHVEGLVLGCLLHDVSYCMPIKDSEDWKNHGRNAAKIARPFLEKLGLEKELLEEICYGIAIHVDDEADFEGVKTEFALSIGDADNIDRFDAYRIYENLQNKKFDQLPLSQKKETVNATLERLQKYTGVKLATKAAQEIWNARIAFQIEFFNHLKSQMDSSEALQ